MRRWLKPDAHRWIRPDYRRFMSPAECKAGFNPEQPRDEQGRWVETGTDEDSSPDDEESRPRFYRGELDEYSDASRAQGHHYVARNLYRGMPLKQDTRAVFDGATTGPLAAQRHGFSQEHKLYNDAVGRLMNDFMARGNISPER